jgi:hypothetical protein
VSQAHSSFRQEPLSQFLAHSEHPLNAIIAIAESMNSKILGDFILLGIGLYIIQIILLLHILAHIRAIDGCNLKILGMAGYHWNQ